jgi:hypothetical protein
MDWSLLWKIFWVFTKIAMFSWGGGPASLGLMQREGFAVGWFPHCPDRAWEPCPKLDISLVLA